MKNKTQKIKQITAYGLAFIGTALLAGGIFFADRIEVIAKSYAAQYSYQYQYQTQYSYQYQYQTQYSYEYQYQYQYQYQTPATTFTGNVDALSTFAVGDRIQKGSGTFAIDHPLDPENKLLFHSFVESPDVKNIYDGIGSFNASGEAVISLPNYFEALHDGQVRYQVKGLSAPAPNIFVKEEITENSFVVAGGIPEETFSWQVSAVRDDPFIQANPIVPEVDKGDGALIDRGDFLYEYYDNEPFGAVLKRMFDRVWFGF